MCKGSDLEGEGGLKKIDKLHVYSRYIYASNKRITY